MWRLRPTLDYEGRIYRPPSEARSIILQATVGCSHNKCIFCESFMDKSYRLKDMAVVEADIEKAAALFPEIDKVFIADGDALRMPMRRWERILSLIAEKLPAVKRVGAYSTGTAVRKKSDEDLNRLKEKGLGILYLGVESGDDKTLSYIRKDSNSQELLDAGRRIMGAGIALSVTILLGIAPPGSEKDHPTNTGRLLTAMDPDFVGVLSVMVCEGTELSALVERGLHRVPDAMGYLSELRLMLENTHMSHGLFMSNHASNYLPLRIKMPGEREGALALLADALGDKVSLRPEERRML